MSNILYIIPGLGQTSTSPGYPAIIKHVQKQGYTVIPLQISWKYRTMSDYMAEFRAQATKHTKDDNITLLGFSFGAYIAFLAATEIPVDNLLLCSLSPYFKEDLPTLRRSWKAYMGKHRIGDFKNYSFDKLSQKIAAKNITLIHGEFECYELIHRVHDAQKKLKHAKVIPLEKTKHDISQKIYINTIKKLL